MWVPPVSCGFHLCRVGPTSSPLPCVSLSTSISLYPPSLSRSSLSLIHLSLNHHQSTTPLFLSPSLNLSRFQSHPQPQSLSLRRLPHFPIQTPHTHAIHIHTYTHNHHHNNKHHPILYSLLASLSLSFPLSLPRSLFATLSRHQSLCLNLSRHHLSHLSALPPL